MDKEYEVLTYVHQEEFASQRKIAANTSCSLGTVNIILKRLIKKGLIKIERINTRALKYVLTPKGIMEKTKLTYQYIKSSYAYINNLNQVIVDLVKEVQARKLGKIYLYGPRDEVLTILKQQLVTQKVEYSYLQKTDLLINNQQGVIVVWRVEDEDKFEGFRTVNVLKMIGN